MRITLNSFVRCVPLMRLSFYAKPRLTNLPGHNGGCNGGTDKPGASDNGRRLIYGSVNLVIGSLREVSLRNCRDADDDTQQ